jgi:methyl-accepting chemotaxis protein
VSESSTEQATAVQETMASISELTSMLSRMMDLAKETRSLTSGLSESTASGSKVMQEMLSSMSEIKTANQQLGGMVEIINDITSKTQIINDIVFKTQLLSVNASIEAARAGQQGKGFAVVAEEVGNLAQVSGKAAEAIREMLGRSQKQVKEIVAATNERVARGESVAHDAEKEVRNIQHGITTIESYTRDVSEATIQQKEGITQISEAVRQMDIASQNNSALAVSVSSLSDTLMERGRMIDRVNRDIQIGSSWNRVGNFPLFS